MYLVLNAFSCCFERVSSLLNRFSAGFYTCPVNGTDSPPYAVSLVSNCSDATTNLLKVVDTGSVDNVNYTKNDSINRRPGTFASQKVRYTVCLALLHSNYSDYKRFIETVELNRMFGARRIIVYVQSTSPDVQLVLDSYSRDGVVETIPWDSLPLTSWTENMNSNDRTMQIHYFGQVAALNDCLYRSLSRSTFVVFTDVDEVVVPRNVTVKTEEAWTDMLEQATHDWLASGSAKFGSFPGVYMIKNVFFPLNLTQRLSNNGSTLNDWLLQSSKVDTDSKTVVYRERYIYPYNERSKYFVWSKAAVMVGIHFPYETIDDDNVQTVYVDERRGLLHHYKVLNVSSNDKDKKYVEDKWADQYSDFLSDRIEARRRAIKIDLKS
jgi:hypothetical protein